MSPNRSRSQKTGKTALSLLTPHVSSLTSLQMYWLLSSSAVLLQRLNSRSCSRKQTT